MQTSALLLCEIGLPENIPGFITDYPASGLPFWGNYYIIDFFHSNFSVCEQAATLVWAPEYLQKQLDFIGERWHGILTVPLPTEDAADVFLTRIHELPQDIFIISALSFVSMFAGRELLALTQKLPYDMIKISVDHIPLDLFIVTKQRLVELIEKNKSRLAAETHFLKALIGQVLHHSFESIEDLSGKVFFHYNLMQYFNENLNYVDYACDESFTDALPRIYKHNETTKESYIASAGSVKNSFLSRGVEVYGLVENSILFPNVTVRKDAQVINSVILNNNKIGNNSLIKNTLILPNEKSEPGATSNIEGNCHIGELSHSLKNITFPGQVHNGVTALGMNARIPKGSSIEAGCFIAADISPQRIKQQKKLKKGESIVGG